MAHTIQFESFDDRSRGAECMACEEMLADAIDGLLSPADQVAFEGHLAACPACAAMLTETREGAAWLDTLAAEIPEPPAGMLERILSQTATLNAASANPAVVPAAIPAMQPAVNVVAFPRQAVYATGWQRASRMMLEPRLAMTAAMAFFSIALTMSLTGVRLNDLHPASLRHNYYATRSSAVRFYDNLRVVHVLESRLEDLREAGFGNLEAPAAARRPDSQSVPSHEGNGPARRLEWTVPAVRRISAAERLSSHPQGGRA